MFFSTLMGTLLFKSLCRRAICLPFSNNLWQSQHLFTHTWGGRFSARHPTLWRTRSWKKTTLQQRRLQRSSSLELKKHCRALLRFVSDLQRASHYNLLGTNKIARDQDSFLNTSDLFSSTQKRFRKRLTKKYVTNH